MPEQLNEVYPGDNISVSRLLAPILRGVLEKYGHSNDRVIMTDELVVPIYVDGEMEMRRIFIKESNMYSYVVCMLDKDEYVPIYSFVTNGHATDVYDRKGKAVTDSLELENVQRLILSVEHTAQMQTEGKVDAYSIQTHAIEGLQIAIESKKQEIERLERLLQRVENKEEPYTTFNITIIDAWEKDGGKSISQVFIAQTLKEAIQVAVGEFKRINNRSDVQCSQFTVSVLDGVEQVLQVPQEVIMPFVQAITKWDRVTALKNNPEHFDYTS